MLAEDPPDLVRGGGACVDVRVERVDLLRTELRRVLDLGQSDNLRRAARRQKQKETERRGEETRGACSPGGTLFGAGFENRSCHVIDWEGSVFGRFFKGK